MAGREVRIVDRPSGARGYPVFVEALELVAEHHLLGLDIAEAAVTGGERAVARRDLGFLVLRQGKPVRGGLFDIKRGGERVVVEVIRVDHGDAANSEEPELAVVGLGRHVDDGIVVNAIKDKKKPKTKSQKQVRIISGELVDRYAE